MNKEEMVEKFQCSGCTLGSDTKCGHFNLSESPGWGFNCESHSAGTFMMNVGRIALGLPIGFCRYGLAVPTSEAIGTDKPDMPIRLYLKGDEPEYDNFNVPVWVLDEDGFLFVRTFAPRTNRTFVDVIEGATLEKCPNALDVGKFKDGMN